MDDLAVVYVLDTEANLREPVQNLILRKILVLAVLLPFGFSLLDFCGQLTVVAVLHDNVEVAASSQEHLLKSDNVWMIKSFEYFRLLHGGPLLARVHFFNVDHFHHIKHTRVLLLH